MVATKLDSRRKDMPISYNQYKINPNITKERNTALIKEIEEDIRNQKQWIAQQEAEIKKQQNSPQANQSAIKYSIESDKRYLDHSKRQLKDLERQLKAAQSRR